jgi:hypothetical protein
MKAQGPAGSGLDQLADLVAVTGHWLNERQHEEFGAAFFPFVVWRTRLLWRHMGLPYMDTQNTSICSEKIAARPVMVSV